MVMDYKYRNTHIENNSCWKCWSISVLLVLVIVIQFYVITTSTSTPSEQKIINASISSEDSKKYTFYHILPNESKLVISDDEINAISREKYFGKDNNIKYSIQVGSFKLLKEAIKHQTQLKKLGFKPTLQSQKFGNTIWNRVKLGPYSIIDVKNNKKKLRKHGVDVVVTKILTEG